MKIKSTKSWNGIANNASIILLLLSHHINASISNQQMECVNGYAVNEFTILIIMSAQSNSFELNMNVKNRKKKFWTKSVEIYFELPPCIA